MESSDLEQVFTDWMKFKIARKKSYEISQHSEHDGQLIE